MSHRVYIVEDEAIVAQDLKITIEQLGHKVVGVAHSRGIALSNFVGLQPDILLSDIRLGEGEDGIQLALELRELLPTPVIFITAYSDKETLKRARAIKPQGYILKPISRNEVDIAIDLAIDEFFREKVLFENQQILNTALSCIGNSVLLVDLDGNIDRINQQACQLLNINKLLTIKQPWFTAVRCASEESKYRLKGLINNASRTHSVSRIFPMEVNIGKNILLLDGIVGPIFDSKQMCLGASIMLRHLADISSPITRPTKRRAIDKNQKFDQAACLLLINPDDFTTVNSHYNTEIGDLILKEINQVINKEMRVIDLATRYGGAVFTATLPNTNLEDGMVVAKRIHQKLSQHRYYSDKLTLTFSMGIAESGEDKSSQSINLPITLFRHATWALNSAHEAGGDCIKAWQSKKSHPMMADIDRLSGIFSPHADQDIQGLMLIWNTVSMVSQTTDISELSKNIISNLIQSLQLQAAGFFLQLDNEPLELIDHQQRAELTTEQIAALDFSVTTELCELAFSGHSKLYIVSHDSVQQLCYGVPLVVDNHGIGLLLLYRDPKNLFSEEQIKFLETLSNYLAVAVDRIILSAKDQDRVKQEITRFDKTTKAAELIYQSEVMQKLMVELRTLAPTDAPVMITGDSGTGKELLARTIHTMSIRKDKPFVVVDCGAIVASLIESELFGHKKGAFTSASEAHQGKFKEADGGSLFLDEIGELPMELQTKLLRFAQEKTFSSVGSNKVETVDVRLIVATNKNLDMEVEKGNFRQDLFYRLNVFSVHSPTLRQRQNDVLLISEHYLKQFNSHYNKSIHGFTDTAKRAMLQHDWPGNVRELRNQIMRAVIVCQSPYIDAEHLTMRDPAHQVSAQQAVAPETAENSSLAPQASQIARAIPGQGNERTSWEVLPHSELQPASEVKMDSEIALLPEVCSLSEMLDTCISTLSNSGSDFNFGNWLENELILLAKEQGKGNNSLSARILSIPEPTLRRRSEQLERQPIAEELVSFYLALNQSLEHWLNQSKQGDRNRLQQLKLKLCQRALAQQMKRQKIAQLAGISEPTLRKVLATDN
jgi:hydrogenase-4 transcriptional activator